MNTDLPLAEQNIVLCRKGTPPLDNTEISGLLKLLPEWRVELSSGTNQPLRINNGRVEDDTGINQLVRSFEFADFAEAAQFSTFVKTMADEANHHPFLHGEGNMLTIRWWTHTIRGLHLNDFIMAARCDAIYRGN